MDSDTHVRNPKIYKNLCIPEEYKYCVKFNMYPEIFKKILLVYPDTTQGITRVRGDTNSEYMPYSGALRVGPHKIWIIERGHVYDLLFENKDACISFNEDIYQKLAALIPPKQTTKQQTKTISIYNLEAGRWVPKAIQDQSQYELIGYTDYLTDFMQEINLHYNHIELLRSIGENRSINSLLVGPPGVGKTTFIRSLASQMNLPIFIVNQRCISSATIIKDVLNPLSMHTGMVLVLFEDFDRFLKGCTDMSALLNALDGIEDQCNIVRVFTGNDLDLIQATPALMNRMSRIFKFHYPTRENFEAKFEFLRTKCSIGQPDPEKYSKFMDIVSQTKNLTLRPFTKFVVRYMIACKFNGGNEDYMNSMLENVDQLSTNLSQ